MGYLPKGNNPNIGIVTDPQLHDTPMPATPQLRHKWIDEHAPDFLFGSDTILASASRRYPEIRMPGLYFQIWQGKICYVGQAACVETRMTQYRKQGRTYGDLAFIVGLPRWALTEYEYAYIEAWSPPWNVETKRRGALDFCPIVTEYMSTLDATGISARYTPTLEAGDSYKAWQLHMLGYIQAHPDGFPLDAEDMLHREWNW